MDAVDSKQQEQIDGLMADRWIMRALLLINTGAAVAQICEAAYIIFHKRPL